MSFSPKEVLDSRKSFSLGEEKGLRTDPDGADLVEFGVKLLLLEPSFTFSTSVFRAGRLETLG